MRYLSLEEVLILHDHQIEKYGGEYGILNTSLLESAVFRPQMTLSGKEVFPSVFEKAAVLAVSLIQFHPFLDGNKRTGLYSALVFLRLNDVKVSIRDSALVKLGIRIATNKIPLKEVVSIFERGSKSKTKRKN